MKRVFYCPECGFTGFIMEQLSILSDEWTFVKPNFCPNCGENLKDEVTKQEDNE